MNIVDVKDRWRLDKKQSLQQKLINTAPPALKLCKQVFNHKNFTNSLMNKNGFRVVMVKTILREINLVYIPSGIHKSH